MGAPKGSTNAAFNLTKVGTEIEGDPKSGRSANKKGKGKNGGSNNASSGSPRTSTRVLPADPGPGITNKSRKSSASNTPTSTPETKKENLPRGVVGFFSRGVKAGSTDTEDRERSDKQSLNTSPHTSPPHQPSPLQGSSPPAPKPPHQPTENPNTTTTIVEVGPANKTLGPSSSGTGLQDKQDNVKPAALPTFDLPTPPASPEIQNQTVPAALEDGPVPSLLETSSGLIDKVEQGDVTEPAALLSSSPLTPPASPETRKLAVQADLENGPAPSNSRPKTQAAWQNSRTNRIMSSRPHFQPPTTSASPTVPADLEDDPAFSARTRKRLARQGHQDDVKSTVLPSSKSCRYCF